MDAAPHGNAHMPHVVFHTDSQAHNEEERRKAHVYARPMCATPHTRMHINPSIGAPPQQFIGLAGVALRADLPVCALRKCTPQHTR